jgi:hypothetical protein
MLRQWPTPWEAFDHGMLHDAFAKAAKRGGLPVKERRPTREESNEMGLNGLTVAQFFLAWAWAKNNDAKWLFSEAAVASGWSEEHAVNAGIRAAVSAARSLTHAQALMAAGDNRLGQNAL